MGVTEIEFYLVTYEWQPLRAGSEWRRENEPISGCPGLWWARYLERVRQIEENARVVYRSFEEKGQTVPIAHQVSFADYRFVGATKISHEGFKALGGTAGEA